MPRTTPAKSAPGLVALSTMAVAGLCGLASAANRLRRRARASGEQLAVTDRRFAKLVECSSEMITVADAGGLVTYDSPSIARVLGYEPAERVGTPVLDYIHPDHLTVARSRFTEGWPMSEGFVTDEIQVRHRDGSWRWVEAVWSNLLGVPEVAGIIVNWREIGERRALEERLFAERDFLGAVLESLEEGVVACDADGVLTLFNEATRRFHGLPHEPVPSEDWAWHYDLFLADETTPMSRDDVPLYRALSGEEVRNVEMVIAPSNGRRRLMRATGRAIFGENGQKLGAVVAMHDITERQESERALERQASTDALTGLGNRTSLAAHLERARRRAAGAGAGLAVLFIDLDNFKRVNDSLGHVAGDAFLVEIAQRLRGRVRSPDVAVRLGGDEFAVLLQDATAERAVLVADLILASIREPVGVGTSQLTLDASIGIALGRGDDESGDKLLRSADLAMYVAKSRGKGAHAVFEPDMHVAALGRLALEADLRRAHAERKFTLAYQPVISLRTGAMVGVEALLRLALPGRSPIRPDEFIPVAEETGLIVPIGAWVLEEACAQLRRWDEDLPDRTALTMAVNVSAKQLLRGGLVGTLVDILERTGVEPARLTLELTESTLMGDDEVAMVTLLEIERLGVKLSIDDFGTGYSSLSRLRTMPANAVKIDRSFVHEIDGPDAEAPLVAATLAMARGLGLSVVAEGVETNDQLELLCRLGCPEAQGFLISRPVEPAVIASMLDDGAPLVDVGRRRGGVDVADLDLLEAVEAVVTINESSEEPIRSLLAKMARIPGLSTGSAPPPQEAHRLPSSGP